MLEAEKMVSGFLVKYDMLGHNYYLPYAVSVPREKSLPFPEVLETSKLCVY